MFFNQDSGVNVYVGHIVRIAQSLWRLTHDPTFNGHVFAYHYHKIVKIKVYS